MQILEKWHTLLHSFTFLFGRRKNRNKEHAVKSSTSTKCRDGGTGRRSGLKIRRYLVPWGFDSPSRHQPQPIHQRLVRNHVSRQSLIGYCTTLGAVFGDSAQSLTELAFGGRLGFLFGIQSCRCVC